MAGKVRILKERLFKVKKDDTKLLYVEGACDNDATPPQGNFVTGSAFENVTSGNKYKYSETSGDWVLQPNEGGGGGSVLVVVADEPMATPPSWITETFEGYIVYETNVTYDQLHTAFGTNVIGLSVPEMTSIINPFRQQVIVELGDVGYIDGGGFYIIAGQIFKYNGNLVTFEFNLVANAENGALYFIMENPD